MEKERTIKTDSNQTTSFLWDGENVLSTPSMISEMEETCRMIIKESFTSDSEKWDSVGTLVNIKHLAATPVGSKVHFKAKVKSIDGFRILFDVTAFDDLEKIGEGTHERFIINILRFKSKFEDKKRKLNIL